MVGSVNAWAVNSSAPRTADARFRPADGGPIQVAVRERLAAKISASPHFCGGLKYRRSGGGWSFLVGIR
jgi:hypothetical protein